MTRVSELQKGQEMVVVDSTKLLPFRFQFFTCLAAVFAEAALRGNVITAKHGSRAFERAFISILPEVRQLGGLRFLLAGLRQHKGGEDCSMVGWISGDGDICV